MARELPWPVALPTEGNNSPKANSSGFLQRIGSVLDWGRVEEVLAAIPLHRATRPRYPSLLLFKIVLLQQWYGLSDPAAEAAVNDRETFAQFVGLPERARSPSYSTINRFRTDLDRRGLSGRLIALVADQIAAQGYELREGAMVEPSLFETRPRPN